MHVFNVELLCYMCLQNITSSYNFSIVAGKRKLTK